MFLKNSKVAIKVINVYETSPNIQKKKLQSILADRSFRKFFHCSLWKNWFSGQTQTKNFDDKETCLREAKKLLSEKLKKGYIDESEFVKTTAPESFLKNHIEKWNEIIKSKDLKKRVN